MKKVIFICLGLFLLFGFLSALIFGNFRVKKRDFHTLARKYKYEDSPFYKNVLKKNDSIIYLNIWDSDSPFSIERYQELIKDKNKIVYNLSIENDSIVVKEGIRKLGIKNDITLENYHYCKEILKKMYHDRYFSIGGDFINIGFSDYKTPMTFVFYKQTLKEKF